MPDTTHLRIRGLAIPLAILVTACFDPSSVEGTATDTTTEGDPDSSGAPPGTGPGPGDDSTGDGTGGGSDDVMPMDTGEPTTMSAEDDSTSGGEPCEPSSEICDGLDNDCDDEIDEDATGTGTPCDTRLEGVCEDGTTTCEGGEIVCVANVEASDEICDGLDNDCDGTPDDGNPVDGVACRTDGMGVCLGGMTSCAGAVLECLPIEAPSAEVCDGLDNDCDGTEDQGNPGGGAPCPTGLAGLCSGGVTQCEAGAIACIQTVFESPEICDSLDNNCDGVVDDGNPGGGAPCVTGQPGICSAGTVSCAAGPAQCTPNQPAAPTETCGNGLDDDCDGVVDDNCGCTHGLCSIGGLLVSGCDPCVTQICAADPFCCNNSWDNQCVNEVESICGEADCISSACAHLVCNTGVALTTGCHPCVTQICAADAFCCNNSWDTTCVNEVGSVCGLAC